MIKPYYIYLILDFYSSWAIFGFHNPVAVVCGGYVVMLSNKSDSKLVEIQIFFSYI